MFVDRIKIFAQAGNGGCGCVSFRREKFVPKGGPDGGDGGRGGDVVLRANQHVDNLTGLFYEPIVKAKNGGHGMGKKMHGRSAPAKIVKVPVGTLVRRTEEGKRPTSNARRPTPNAGAHDAGSDQCAIANPQSEIELVIDLTRDGQEFVLCCGGAGGKGNVHFKSSRNRAPREYTEGEEGEQGHFLLELRTIADAGLVGYPNAGKSTLLREISAARPKVAPYPFTTLHPVIGVVEFSGYRRATIADIPGLIEGAHRNLGLGHDFLRHITRCHVLLFVVDVAGSEGRNPIEDLQNLRREIDLYDPILSERPWFAVANKMDLPGADENLLALQKRFSAVELAPISAATGEGLDAFKTKLEQWLTSASEKDRHRHLVSRKTKQTVPAD
ncbi:MAG: GTPase ObgE [Verrucomicrobia bacterium]|nr:MAG: GTPase ObgE [Verrucomicrobiota bacterium]